MASPQNVPKTSSLAYNSFVYCLAGLDLSFMRGVIAFSISGCALWCGGLY